MGLDWASTHQTTLLNGPGPPFPHLSSLGKLNQAGKKKGQAPQPGSPLWHPAQVFGEAPSPCQACVPDWVPIFGYPSGFLLVSCCHGYWSQLLWQKKTPPGQHSASPPSPHPNQFQVPSLPRLDQRKKQRSQEESGALEKLRKDLSSQIAILQP